MSSNGILSVIGWYFIPNFATNILVNAVLRTKLVSPVNRGTLYKHAYTSIIIAYLAFSVYDAYYSVKFETGKKGRDLYEILSVSPHASIEEIRKSYRKASQAGHPDKRNGLNHQGFMKVTEAYELLKNDVLRLGYDVLGSDFIDMSFSNEASGLTPSSIVYSALAKTAQHYAKYILSISGLYWLFGFGKDSLWWRYLTIAVCFMFELYIVTHQNTFFTFVIGLQPYKQAQLIHSFLMTLTVGMNQLFPLFDSRPSSSIEESVSVIHKTSENVNKMAERIFGLESAPFARNNKSEVSKLVYDTSIEMALDSHLIVQDAMNTFREQKTKT